MVKSMGSYHFAGERNSLAQPLSIRRVQQKEAHCGPASLEMLFGFYGLSVPQEALVEAVGMTQSIRYAPGMRLDELAKAVEALFPQGDYVLLGKYSSSVQDLALLVNEFRQPVGVEWQGRFIQAENRLIDQGHYSVIVGVDLDRNMLEVVDPEEKNILTTSGEISVPVFEARWWEVDKVPVPNNGSTPKILWTERLAFVLARRADLRRFEDVGLCPVSLSMMWAANSEPT